MTALDTPGAFRPRGAASPAGAPDEVDGQRVPLLARPMASFYLIASASALLLGLGLVMVLSASSVTSYASSGSSFSVFTKQVMWVGFGTPAMLLVMRMSTRTLRLLAYPLMLITILGLMAVLVPGLGVNVNGATRWVGVGPFQIQPSEIAKLALCLWGADLLVRKRKRIVRLRHLLVPLLPGAFLIVGLVMLQPDLGTTLVILSILLALLWVVGAPARLFGALFALIGVGVTYLAVVEPYRLERLASFTDPFKDSQDTGFQAVQGLYALASGGWWGVGLGASREKWSYLPNAHTDFILAIIGEELGLVGTLLVVVLFGVLAYAGIRVAQRSAEPFGRLAASAITAWLIGQALINMGAVVGLVPITGIPLPLISFGGSSLMITMVAIGVLLAVAKTEPAAAQVLAARAASRSAHRTATGGRGPLRRLFRRPSAVGGKAERRRQGSARPAERGTRGAAARTGDAASRTEQRRARQRSGRSAETSARGSRRFASRRTRTGSPPARGDRPYRDDAANPVDPAVGDNGRNVPPRTSGRTPGRVTRAGAGAARPVRSSERRTRRRRPSR